MLFIAPTTFTPVVVWIIANAIVWRIANAILLYWSFKNMVYVSIFAIAILIHSTEKNGNCSENRNS